MQQLMASMADSQRTTRFDPFGPTQKYPVSFRVPGAMPRHTCVPVPRSSAPIGRFAFPATIRKTALARWSAYSLPASISGWSTDEESLRQPVR